MFIPLLLVKLFTTSNALTHTFYGADEKRNSYANYNTWVSSTQGLLTLTFQTTEPDGLIVYADDQYLMRGNGNFFKLKLADGSLVVQIQISFSQGSMSFKSEGQVLMLGTKLNDNREHIVIIQRHNRHMTINLDGDVKNYTSPNEMASLHINSSVYVGGIQSSVNTAWMDNSILDEKR